MPDTHAPAAPRPGAVWTTVAGWSLAVLVVVGVTAWFWHEDHEFATSGLDLRVYRDAARAFLDGQDVYADRFQDLPFTYPPFALLVLVPFALVSETAATALMYVVSVAALVLVVRWCQEYAAHDGEAGPWWATVTAALLAGLLVEPLHVTLGLGQINLLLLALILGVDARQTRAAGAGAGIATAVKVTPGLLVVAQAVRGDRRAFVRGVLAFLAATGLAALVAPAATRTYFGSLLWDSSRPGGVDYLQNQSLRAAAARHVPDHAVAVWALSALLVLALGAWVVRRHRDDAFFALTGAAMTALLVSPISWNHHWVWMVPCLAVGWRYGARSPVAWASVALVLAGIDAPRLWETSNASLLAQDIYVLLGVVWLVAAAARPAARAPRPDLAR
jgi:alpha-1,2-mannosyltransferase